MIRVGGGDCAQGAKRDALLFALSPVPTWVLAHRDKTIIEANEAAALLYARSLSELCGLDARELFEPATRDAQLAALLAEPAPDAASTDWRHCRADGAEVWVSLAWRVTELEGERVSLVTAQDITARVATEQRLRASETRYRLISQATNDAIYDWDVRADKQWWGDGFETLFGYERATLEPGLLSWERRLAPEDEARAIASLRAAIDSEQTLWVEEYRFRRADGSVADVMERGHIVRDAEGKALRILGGMRDVSVLRQQERELREHAALIEAANDAIVAMSLDGTVSYWNRAAAKLYGIAASEAIGSSFFSLLPDCEATLTRALDETIANGGWSGELAHERREGGEVILVSRWSLVSDARVGRARILAIGSDITERRQLENLYMRTQRLDSIGRLAGGIAHDLNNVLTPIVMSIELLKKASLDASTRQSLDIIESSAMRGVQMVRQVLSFARGIEGPRVVLRPRDSIAETARLARDSFLQAIEVRVDITDEPWPVVGDPTQLQQLLLNLAVNARDAMPEGGELVFGARNIVVDEAKAAMHIDAQPGPYVELSVKDSGVGIAPERRSKIFEPFFSSKAQGTGLGLPTAQAIARSHGGFILLESESGKGTTFRVYLPASPSAAPSVRRDAPEPMPRGRGEVVLVVDDDVSIRTVTCQTLEAFGYKTVQASDGGEAVALYGKHLAHIDVVLTDLCMPVMDGPALIRALRAVKPSAKIIAVSGWGMEADALKEATTAASCFLLKPYTASQLLQMLRGLLDESAAR